MTIDLISKRMFPGLWKGKPYIPMLYAAKQGDLITVASSKSEVVDKMFNALYLQEIENKLKRNNDNPY